MLFKETISLSFVACDYVTYWVLNLRNPYKFYVIVFKKNLIKN